MTETIPKLFRLEDDVPCANRTFRRLALVSTAAHIEALSPLDDATLIVCCDWLTWQIAAAKGLACIHYECALTGKDPDGLMSDLYIKASDWVYVDGVDVTRFRGVSLGRKFFKETGLVIFECCKIAQTLTALIDRFNPEEIFFLDYRADLVFLSPDARFELISRLAKARGCTTTDLRHASNQPDASHTVEAAYDVSFNNSAGAGKNLRNAAMRFLELAVDLICRVRRGLGSHKISVLMLNTHLTAVPLLREFDGASLYPIFIGIHFPRKRELGFVARAILKGVQLAARPDVRLKPADTAEIDAMCHRLEEAWEKPAGLADSFVQRYVRERVIAPRRLHEMAHTVVWADRLLSRHKPDRVVTDGLQNATYCTFLELARGYGIPTAVTWHGHYLIDMKLETLGGDSRVAPLADYCLSWGQAQDDWLAKTAAKSISVRTGNPIAGQHFSDLPASSTPGSVLILQYAPLLQDLHAPQTQAYAYFIEVVRLLRELGYTDICYRLHPGHARTSYYQDIADHFGLTCRISDSGPFRDVLEPAEFVIGPVTTGAMMEVLGAGKPYYPMLLEPHSMNASYLRGSKIFASVSALRAELVDGTPLDQRGLLNDFTSRDQIANPAQAMWRSICRDMTETLPA